MYRIQRILVPCDYSKFSDAAVSRACSLAETLPAELHLLHVVTPPKWLTRSEVDADELRHAKEHLEAYLDPEVVVRLHVERTAVSGAPPREICRYALEQNIDLIVMGTHGRTGVARLALGSVAEKVLRTAPCPVLIVRPAEESQDLVGQAANQTQEPVFSPLEETTPAVDLIARAALLRATDIHIDPAERGHTVRFRIDGKLQRYCALDSDVASHLIKQYKTLAGLDIADPFHPQEGRLRLPAMVGELEVRLTSSPVAAGEAMALRLFDRESVFRRLDRLGLSAQSLAAVDEMLARGEGLVLVTGPTGSGKTTTVYAMLEVLSTAESSTEERNIVSIEDPVEYPAAFVRQMEVDERHGVSMSSGLRTLLRMDPDVVFVGEVRDAEAAAIAMRAASSGKYVLSTLHTRDVASTVTALRDLHVDCRSLAGNLSGILSQRVVRRLCTQCRRSVPVDGNDQALFAKYGIELGGPLFQAGRCDHCRGTGYHGRVGIFEVALVSNDLARDIAHGATEHEIREHVRRTGVPELMADVLTKVADGITSLDEAKRMRSL